jgi:hypothetical protein
MSGGMGEFLNTTISPVVNYIGTETPAWSGTEYNKFTLSNHAFYFDKDSGSLNWIKFGNADYYFYSSSGMISKSFTASDFNITDCDLTVPENYT